MFPISLVGSALLASTPGSLFVLLRGTPPPALTPAAGAFRPGFGFLLPEVGAPGRKCSSCSFLSRAALHPLSVLVADFGLFY